MCDLQNGVQVPSYFICPISLDIMKDPVTLSTGITYDRDSIEKWLFSKKNKVCPMTKQVVVDIELTPNLTLRRLIHSWCTLNPSSGVERCLDPRPPTTKTEIIKLLKDSKSPHLQMASLKRLRTIVFESERSKRLLESVGAVDHLSFTLTSVLTSTEDTTKQMSITEDALTILYHLQLSPTAIKSLFEKTEDFVDTLTRMMQRDASHESRTYAVMLLKSMFQVVDPMHATSLNPKFFTELINILIDQISIKATKAALKLLINVCSSSRNRVKATKVDAVAVLIDTLLNHTERRVSEMIIILLDQLCQCAEGRAGLLRHRGGLAVVSKKIFRVSSVASESAVRILHSVVKYSGERSVVHEMLELGVVGKLCLVMNVDCGKKMKEKAKEILKMNSRVWKTSPCIPNNLVSSYP
ncbi:putative U box domain, armadillo-like helical, Zinc finger, RING/FYVE/PHD-type [Helianthus debilis subsp. tardiflorus]